MNQAIGNLIRRDLALLVEPATARFRDALDTGLDRNASCAAEQIDHRLVPQVNARLDAELNSAGGDRLQHVGVGQKNLVDEIDVLGAIANQAIEFFRDNFQRTPAEQ